MPGPNLRERQRQPIVGGALREGLGRQTIDLLERGRHLESYAECLIPALPAAVARRELDHLGAALGWQGEQLRTPVVRQNEGPGNALMATLAYEHVCEVATRFGEKGVSSESVAAAVAAEVRAYEASTGVLGPHLADQWALPLALAVWRRGGAAAFTCTELTDHATTNFTVIERFLPVSFESDAIPGGWRIGIAAKDSPSPGRPRGEPCAT